MKRKTRSTKKLIFDSAMLGFAMSAAILSTATLMPSDSAMHNSKAELKALVAALVQTAPVKLSGPVQMRKKTPAPKKTVTNIASHKEHRNQRYKDLLISSDDIMEMTEIVWLEARGESIEGQKAVAEVILNRVVHPDFPNNVHDVIFEGIGTEHQQFVTASFIDQAEPTYEQYDAVYRALYGSSTFWSDVVFFSREGENDNVAMVIGNHVFCREYDWGEKG